MSNWSRLPDIKQKLSKRWKTGLYLRELLPGGEAGAGQPDRDQATASNETGIHTTAQPDNQTDSVDSAEATLFPLRVPLRRPSSREMVQQFPAVQNWVSELQGQEQRGSIRLEWQTVQHRQLGRNQLPTALIFPTVDDIACFLGQQPQLQLFRVLSRQLLVRLPELTEWTRQNPFALLQHADVLDRLIHVVEWLRKHPRPGIYLRELSLPGVDTKFVELHRAMLAQWLDVVLKPDAIDTSVRGAKGFARRYGFRTRPALVRFRILDDELRHAVGGWSDLTVTAAEFQGMQLPVRRVFVCENDLSALAFPAVPGSIMLFGRGYDFSPLAGTRWLENSALLYWGDIDTHGFAILNQFRSLFPQAESLLMDRETLLRHHSHWGYEPRPTHASLSRLTEHEQALYRELCNNSLGDKLRLEQEFIAWDWVCQYLQAQP
ncbi:MAG: Wadjet anti-phage system protein JetD domain-containing protein [Spirochaeta sp.]